MKTMKIMKAFSSLLLVFLFFSSTQLFSAESARKATAVKKVLTNCNVIDCTGAKPMKGMTVVITGNVITDIYQGAYKGSADAAGVEVFDLQNGYVLPGFWNVHMHMATLLPDPNQIERGEALPSAMMRAALNCMDGLQHGFTGVRPVGEREYLDVDLRDVFDQGYFLGPRIFTCGEAVSPTGGHRGDVPSGADGVAEMRKAIRTRVVHGVDWIKIMGVEMLDDELQAAIETSHHMGLRITSHSKEPSTYRAVKAGIDCIEHGYNIEDETLTLMGEKGTFYVPTIICNLSDQYIREREQRLAELGHAEDEKIVKGRTMIAYADERSQAFAEYQRNALVKAFKAGVKVCTGSDSAPIGEIGILEIEQFVLSGVDEMDALIAATRNCADLCGVIDQLGTVEKGKLADLVVVAADPLENISNIRKVKMVLKDGISVDLDHSFGPASYWDYFFTRDQQKGFAAAADKSAGFVR